MRRIVMLSLLLSLSLTSYSQSIYQSVKAGSRGLKVRRTITVNPSNFNLARKVVAQRAVATKVNVNLERAVIMAEMRQPVNRPEKMVGGYNYLRMAGKAFKPLSGWQHVGDSRGYNGAHHIVTRAVIAEIANDLKIAEPGEVAANAPSIYHPLHHDPDFNYLFHDHAMLLDMYKQKGVQGVVLDFFHRVNRVNGQLGLPLYDNFSIQMELLEAELWAKHWGLKWN